jgi:hypothetical protein
VKGLVVPKVGQRLRCSRCGGKQINARPETHRQREIGARGFKHMTGLGFGIGLGLVLSMLIWIGFEELRKKGPLSKEAPNILSAIAAGFSALTTLGLVFIGFQQWRVQEHTDAVQSAMSRANLFPMAFESKGPPALAQNFLATFRFRNG